jgi:hypothetical protein
MSGTDEHRSLTIWLDTEVRTTSASTEMLAAKRHAGVHTPVIACKTIIANQTLAYAA